MIALAAYVAGGGSAYILHRFAAPSQAAQDWTRTPLYLHRINLFSDLRGSTHDIVLLGDSITALANWNELLPGVSVANRGIMGDNTEGLLRRIAVSVPDGTRYAALMIGVNDFIVLHANVADVWARYRRILSYLHSRNIGVIAQSTLFTSRADSADVNAKVAQLNSLIRENCKAPGCHYIDLNRQLAPAGLLDAAFSIDGLHLNGDGYRPWAKALSAIIATITQKQH